MLRSRHEAADASARMEEEEGAGGLSGRTLEDAELAARRAAIPLKHRRCRLMRQRHVKQMHRRRPSVTCLFEVDDDGGEQIAQPDTCMRIEEV